MSESGTRQEGRFCENCGAELSRTANFCPRCGAAQQPSSDRPTGSSPQSSPSDIPEPGRISTPNVDLPPPPGQPQQPITVTVQQTQTAHQTQSVQQTRRNYGCGTGCLVIMAAFLVLGILGAILGALSGENGAGPQVGIIILLAIVALAILEWRRPGTVRGFTANVRHKWSTFRSPGSAPGPSREPPAHEPNYGQPPGQQGQQQGRQGNWHPHPDDPPQEESKEQPPP